MICRKAMLGITGVSPSYPTEKEKEGKKHVRRGTGGGRVENELQRRDKS